MKITKKILKNIIKEELDNIEKERIQKKQSTIGTLATVRAALNEAVNNLVSVPKTKEIRKNINATIYRLLVISDMLKGKYNKDNAEQYGLALPPGKPVGDGSVVIQASLPD